MNPSTGYTVRARSYSYFNNTYSAYASATVTTGGTVVAEDDIANDQLALALSGTSLSLTNGGGSAQTFSNSSVGLGNVTNHTQVKDDGSNAPNILKNDQISLSASSGTVTLNNASSSNNTFDKSSIALDNVPNTDATNASNISSGTINLSRTPSTVRNDNISIEQGNSGVLTLTRYSGATDTTTITKAKLGLSYTDGATNNGTTINSSGNITGNMSVGATLTLGTSANNKIVCGNVTIDGETGRILIED